MWIMISFEMREFKNQTEITVELVHFFDFFDYLLSYNIFISLLFIN